MRCKLQNNCINATCLMINLKKFNAFSHSNVDLFQYFQLMKKISTIFRLIDNSFRSIIRVKRIY